MTFPSNPHLALFLHLSMIFSENRYPLFQIMLLEPRQVGKRELAAMHMDAAEFGAAVQGRKHFSGIEQALRVKSAFQPLLLVEIDLRKHLAHQIALFDADAVLAGQNAAEFDAAAQNVGAKSLRTLHLAGLVGV